MAPPRKPPMPAPLRPTKRQRLRPTSIPPTSSWPRNWPHAIVSPIRRPSNGIRRTGTFWGPRVRLAEFVQTAEKQRRPQMRPRRRRDIAAAAAVKAASDKAAADGSLAEAAATAAGLGKQADLAKAALKRRPTRGWPPRMIAAAKTDDADQANAAAAAAAKASAGAKAAADVAVEAKTAAEKALAEKLGPTAAAADRASTARALPTKPSPILRPQTRLRRMPRARRRRPRRVGQREQCGLGGCQRSGQRDCRQRRLRRRLPRARRPPQRPLPTRAPQPRRPRTLLATCCWRPRLLRRAPPAMPRRRWSPSGQPRRLLRKPPRSYRTRPLAEVEAAAKAAADAAEAEAATKESAQNAVAEKNLAVEASSTAARAADEAEAAAKAAAEKAAVPLPVRAAFSTDDETVTTGALPVIPSAADAVTPAPSPASTVAAPPKPPRKPAPAKGGAKKSGAAGAAHPRSSPTPPIVAGSGALARRAIPIEHEHADGRGEVALLPDGPGRSRPPERRRWCRDLARSLQARRGRAPRAKCWCGGRRSVIERLLIVGAINPRPARGDAPRSACRPARARLSRSASPPWSARKGAGSRLPRSHARAEPWPSERDGD